MAISYSAEHFGEGSQDAMTHWLSVALEGRTDKLPINSIDRDNISCYSPTLAVIWRKIRVLESIRRREYMGIVDEKWPSLHLILPLMGGTCEGGEAQWSG